MSQERSMELVNILVPVYNDWESLSLLAERIKHSLQVSYRIVVVNDGSSEACPANISSDPVIQVIHLVRNLGHQRAISIGLAYISENYSSSSVVVMDGDGEDKPEHIKDLMQEGLALNKVVFAKRINRQESLSFRILYYFYKKVFVLMTGKSINFGNFSYVPNECLKKLVHISEIWNNYPAGAIYSRIPFSSIALSRGTRLAGKSKMNHYSLIHHGLSAMSVLIETVAVRLLVFSLIILAGLFIISATVIFFKLFTNITSPGWTTTIVFGCLTMSMQILALLVFFAFMTLSNRSNRKIIPIYDYRSYIAV